MSEDQSKDGCDSVQKICDGYVKKVDDMVKAKEEELKKV